MKNSCPLWSDSLHRLHPDLRSYEAYKSLENLRPSNESQHHCRTMPYVVKCHDDAAKVQQEKAFEKWTYVVSSWTVDSLLKERSQLLAEKKDESKKDEATKDESDSDEKDESKEEK